MALTPQEFEKLKIQLQNRKFAKSQIPNADGGFDVVGAIKGKTSFPASMGGITTTAPLENIAKTFGNIPSSVAKMAAPVNPLTTDSPINIGANIAGSGSALYEIYKNRGLAGAKDILGGFADTYLKVGESIYGGIDKAYNALLDDPKKAIADVTERIAKIGIEDPMLIPTILYGSGKLKGGKDPISRFASPITRGADTSLLNVAEKTGIPSLARGAVDITEKIAEKTKTSLFGRPKPISNIDDVIKQADEAMKSDFVASQPLAKEAPKTGLTPSQILTATKQATAQPSLMERWAGIRPDIKNRIAGKPNMMKEYFDVSHARNNFDTLPDPLGYGVKKGVNPAIEIMETKLNKTGNAIGEFRQK